MARVGEPRVFFPGDYGALGDVFLMCTEARVTEVVERGVKLSIRGQNRCAWPHAFWEPGKPMYREDGTLVPSTQMAAAGVSDEYVVLLPNWIDITEIDGRGGITFTLSLVNLGR